MDKLSEIKFLIEIMLMYKKENVFTNKEKIIVQLLPQPELTQAAVARALGYPGQFDASYKKYTYRLVRKLRAKVVGLEWDERPAHRPLHPLRFALLSAVADVHQQPDAAAHYGHLAGLCAP